MTRSIVHYGIAIMAERVLMLFLIPVLTGVVSLEEYAVWTQVVTVSAVLTNIVLMGYYSAISRFLAGVDDRRYITTLFLSLLCLVLINLLVVAVVITAIADQIGQWIYGDPRFISYVYALIFVVGADSLFDMTVSLLVAQKRLSLVSVYTFVRHTSRVLILIAGVAVLRMELVDVIIMGAVLQTAVAACVFYFHDIPRLSSAVSLKVVPWRDVLWFCIFMSPYTTLSWLVNFVGRFVILHQVNLRSVGIYAIAGSIVSAIGLIHAVLGFGLQARLASLWNQGQKRETAELMRRVIDEYLFFAVPGVIVVSIYLQDVIFVLAGADYLPPPWLSVWLALGAFFFGLYHLYHYAMLILKRTAQDITLLLLAVPLTLWLNVALVPRWGIQGAAVATLLTSLGLFAVEYGMVRRASWELAAIPSVKQLIRPTAAALAVIALVKAVDVGSPLIAVVAGGGGAVVAYVLVDMVSRPSFIWNLKRTLQGT